MRVVEHRQPVRAGADDFFKRAPETLDCLVGKPVDEVHADGTETELARLLEHRERLGLALDAVHRLLHHGLEILHAHAQAVETEPAQQRERFGTHLARIDLEAVFALVVVAQPEMLARDVHQLLDFLVADESRRAPAPVQLLDDACAVEELRLHGDLAMQAAEIRRGALAVLGDHLVAGAVETHGVAEREMEIQRQRTQRRCLIGTLCPRAIVGFGETGMKLHRRRIRGIARSALVVTTDQVGVERQLMGRDRFRHGWSHSLLR